MCFSNNADPICRAISEPSLLFVAVYGTIEYGVRIVACQTPEVLLRTFQCSNRHIINTPDDKRVFQAIL
jgi:hypothetical protein